MLAPCLCKAKRRWVHPTCWKEQLFHCESCGYTTGVLNKLDAFKQFLEPAMQLPRLYAKKKGMELQMITHLSQLFNNCIFRCCLFIMWLTMMAFIWLSICFHFGFVTKKFQDFPKSF